MATKRLQRTVIEGGRYRHNKWIRRQSHRNARAHDRAALAQLRNDPGAWDDHATWHREVVHRSFYDKLAPAERWLASRVGKSWRQVEGEILGRFDTRSLAGRHIVFDHLLPPSWSTTRERSWRVHRRVFYIDANGVLRVRPAPRMRTPPSTWAQPMRAWVVAWMKLRQIGRRGTRAYWLDPVTDGESRWTASRYRQGRLLDPDEQRILTAFNETELEAFTRDLD